jgi:hypothetical protein
VLPVALLTDCLTAGGTFGIAVGSGLQAGGELRRYGAVARGLGLTDAADKARDLWGAYWRLYGAIMFLPLSLWPGFSWSIWRLGGNAKRFYVGNINYYKAVMAIGSASLTEKLTKEDRAAAQELGWKSTYWFLIMVGTLVVFAGSIVGIISDLS